MRKKYSAPPGTEICTPGARSRLLKRRSEFIADKINRRTHYIHYKAAGNTVFEENILSHKIQIYLIRNDEDPEYHIFSEKDHDFCSKRMLLYFHPCIRGRRQIRDMSVDFQKELTQDNRYLRQLLRGSRNTSLFLLQSVKFDGEDNGIPLTHIYATRNFNPPSSRQSSPDDAVDDNRRDSIHRFDFVEVMYDDDEGVQQTGMAQILAILGINRKYRTKQVLFYIQWLQVDSATSNTSLNERYLPFELLRYERVLDEYGRKSNTYQRQFVVAESINRPAFVIPTSVLLSDAHKELISDTRTFLNIPYLFFNRVESTPPTTYLRDADRHIAAQRRGAARRSNSSTKLNKDFRFVLDSNAIPTLTSFWLYNRRRDGGQQEGNIEEEDDGDPDVRVQHYDALQDEETEESDVSLEQEIGASDIDDDEVDSTLQNDEEILIEEDEAQEMQRFFKD